MNEEACQKQRAKADLVSYVGCVVGFSIVVLLCLSTIIALRLYEAFM